MKFLIALVLCLLAFAIAHILDRREAKRESNKRITKCVEDVKKYARKFNSSMSHLNDIKDAVHELSMSNKLKYLKPFEAYNIPTKNYYFNCLFYLLTTENLEYRIVITKSPLYKEDNTKKVKLLLEYSMTLEEFDKFVDECKEENYKAGLERYRREQIDSVLNKAIK